MPVPLADRGGPPAKACTSHHIHRNSLQTIKRLTCPCVRADPDSQLARQGMPVPLEDSGGPPAEELAAQVAAAVQERLEELLELLPSAAAVPAATG